MSTNTQCLGFSGALLLLSGISHSAHLQDNLTWSQRSAAIRSTWQNKVHGAPKRIHEYWTNHSEEWRSGWNDFRGDAKAIWTDHIDPRETYTEEVAEALRDPETAIRIGKAVLSGNGKQMVAEKARWLPVYDPYEGKLRTLDAAAQDFVGRNGEFFEGGAFGEDPVGATTLTLMLDARSLWGKRILRTKGGDWVSIQAAVGMEGFQQETVARLGDLHSRARSAFQAGDEGLSMDLLGQFSDLVQATNHDSLGGGQATGRGEELFQALSAAQGPSSALAAIEAAPLALLRSARKAGQAHRAAENLEAIVNGYPHSGFADDALMELAKTDFEGMNLGRCTERLNLLLERYPGSNRCDDALYLLGVCYESRDQALHEYQDAFPFPGSGSAHEGGAAPNSQEAQDCYSLLSECFSDSPHCRRAQEKARALGKPRDRVPRGGDEFTNSIGMKFLLLPAGSFEMGSPAREPDRNSDEALHSVRLAESFYLGETEVTQAQWNAVWNKNPSRFKGSDLPVEQVTWGEAVGFCHELSLMEPGMTYRLPTEAEWEYACRAGTRRRYSYGAREAHLGRVAWYSETSARQTHPVKQKEPNPWGLHDMHGNVWEWCADWYSDSYYQVCLDQGLVTNPIGPESGSRRVIRGGGWYDFPARLRSAHRLYHTPSSRDADGGLGFRVLAVRP